MPVKVGRLVCNWIALRQWGDPRTYSSTRGCDKLQPVHLTANQFQFQCWTSVEISWKKMRPSRSALIIALTSTQSSRREAVDLLPVSQACGKPSIFEIIAFWYHWVFYNEVAARNKGFQTWFIEQYKTGKNIKNLLHGMIPPQGSVSSPTYPWSFCQCQASILLSTHS